MTRPTSRPRRLLQQLTLVFSGLVLLGGCERLAGTSDVAYLERARALSAKGNHSAAIIETKNALQRSPDNVAARLMMGQLYVRAGRGQEGEIALKQAREAGAAERDIALPLAQALLIQGHFKRLLTEVSLPPDASNADAARFIAVLGEAQIETGRLADAKASFERAVSLEADLPEGLLGQARLAMVNRSFEEAASTLDRVLEKSPSELRALVMRGDLARARGKPDAAKLAFAEVLEKYPSNLTAHVNLATLEIAAGNLVQAGKHIEAVRGVPGAAVMALYQTSLLEFAKKNYGGARDQMQKVLAAAPDNPPALLLAAAIERELGSNPMAERYLRQLLATRPQVAAAQKMLVDTLLRSDQVPQAIEAVQPALKQSPNDAELLNLAGQAHMRAKQFTKAGDFFSRAISLQPSDAASRRQLGLSRLAAGDTDRAIADLEAAIQADPKSDEADLALIVSHVGRGAHDKALEAIDSLEKRQPPNPITHNFRGGALLAKKDVAGARAAFERALSLDAAYVPAAVNLARLDLARKDAAAAKRRFTSILDKNPGSVEALLALAELARATAAPPAEYRKALERASAADPKAVKPLVLLATDLVRDEPNKALELAGKAAALSPNDGEALDALGSAQLAMGETAAAQATYARLVSLQPELPVAHLRLASILARNGNQAGAIRELQSALALDPDYLEAQAGLIALDLNAGNTGRALKLSRQIQAKLPASPVGYILEGDALMVERAPLKAAGSYEKGLALAKNGSLAVKLHAAYDAAGKKSVADARLKDWLKVAPEDLTARYYLASTAQKGRQFDLAIEQYEAILKKHPDDPLVLNDLAIAYDGLKDPRALPTAERAYKLRPEEPAIADTLGWMLVQQGSAPRGLQVLRSAVSKSPDVIEIRMHVVHALIMLGEKDQAIDELKRVLNLRGNHQHRDEAKKLLSKLEPDR